MKPEGGIDPIMFDRLHTTFTLDQALDLVEIETVQRSWHAAQKRNDEQVSDIIQARQERESAG